MATISSRSSAVISISAKAVPASFEIAQAKPSGVAEICGDQRFARGQGRPGLLHGGGLWVDQAGVIRKAALDLTHGSGAVIARLIDPGAEFGDGIRVLFLLGRVQGLGQESVHGADGLAPVLFGAH